MSYRKGSIGVDNTGKRFGRWRVLSSSHQHPTAGNWLWNVICDCGAESVVEGSSLRRGESTQCKSCGGRENGRKGLYSKSKNQEVYFIRCGNYIKIGASDDVYRRLRDLQGSNPYPLELIATDTDEELWHNIFSHRLHRHEWFKFTEESGG